MGGGCCKKQSPTTGKRDLKAAINSKKKLCLWVLGGPGSGKGTQCKMLAMHFKLAHISTGDLLRNAIQNDDPLSKEIKETMERGALVDTHTVLELLRKAMEDMYDNCNGYLIDGYPREVEQGDLFCAQIGNPQMIIYLDCPDDILMERLMKRGLESGRVDDNEETIKARLTTFHQISEPVIEKWRSKVVTIDASLSPLDVEKECIGVIEKLEDERLKILEDEA